jgi:hypothetical protein
MCSAIDMLDWIWKQNASPLVWLSQEETRNELSLASLQSVVQLEVLVASRRLLLNLGLAREQMLDHEDLQSSHESAVDLRRYCSNIPHESETRPHCVSSSTCQYHDVYTRTVPYGTVVRRRLCHMAIFIHS